MYLKRRNPIAPISYLVLVGVSSAVLGTLNSCVANKDGGKTNTKTDASSQNGGGIADSANGLPDGAIIDSATALGGRTWQSDANYTANGGSYMNAGAGGEGASGRESGTGGTGLDAGSDTLPFCQGSAKVHYSGKTLDPVSVATSWIMLPLDCCNGHITVRMRTIDAFGFDICLSFLDNYPFGAFNFGPSSFYEAIVYVCDSEFQLQPVPYHQASGLHPNQSLSGTGTLETCSNFFITLCATVQEPNSSLDGARIYVDRTPIATDGWASRFEIRLLQDTTITADKAMQTPLDQLQLGDLFMDLLDISYYDIETHEIGWNNGRKILPDLSIALPLISTYGLPFVVLADGQRVYVGAFMTAISSLALNAPSIMKERTAGDIYGFTIQAGYPGTSVPASPDPRADPRIVKVLDETGKSVK